MLHLRRFDYTGRLILIALQWTQLWIGTEQPFLHIPYEDYHHLVPTTWISHLWQYADLRQLTFDTTRSYGFKKQCVNDEFIVDVIRPHFTPTQLKYINRYRLTLQLLRVSDMVACRGKNILPNIKHFASNRTSQLLWPKQPLPKRNRALWKEACVIIQKYVPAHRLGD